MGSDNRQRESSNRTALQQQQQHQHQHDQHLYQQHQHRNLSARADTTTMLNAVAAKVAARSQECLRTDSASSSCAGAGLASGVSSPPESHGGTYTSPPKFVTGGQLPLRAALRQLRGVAEGISPAAARRAASARAEGHVAAELQRGSPERRSKKGAITDDFDAVGANDRWQQRTAPPAEDRY